jgi:tetratricopeptide (TPR) repeat protein
MKPVPSCAFVFSCLVAFCFRPTSALPLSSLDSAKVFLVYQNYMTSENLLKRIIADQPDNMEALYLFLAVEQTKILDYESYSIESDSFNTCAVATLAVLNKALPGKKGRENLNCLFYIGNTLGGISIMQAKVGNWPSAVRSGLNSIGYFKRVVKTDPNYFSAYLGIGFFNYYISQNLKWLPFFGDRRKDGLEQIRLATKSDFPYSLVARNSLCWILMENNDYRSADSIASDVLRELPENTIFIRLKARIALWKSEWPAAIFWSKKLIELSEKRTPVNWSDLLSGYQILIASYDSCGRKKECLDQCRKILSRRVPEPFSRIPYVKKHLKTIADVRKKYKGT